MDENHFLLGQLRGLLKPKADNIHILQRFLKRRCYDLNYQVPQDTLFARREPRYLGYSALHFAVEYEKEDFVELLLSHGADFTLKTANGFTPLRLALEKMKNSVQTIFSTKAKDISRLQALLSVHVQSNNAINPSCSDGISHFHIACLANNIPVVRFFLEAGVSVNESVNETSDLFSAFTPLHFAVRYGGDDLVKLLLTHGADLNRVDSNGLTLNHLLIKQSIEINNWESNEWNYYRYTTSQIEFELLRNDTLIETFASINGYKVDDIGLSFHVSCTMTDSTLAERLLKSGADVSCKVNDGSPMWSGYTPGHFAAHCNRKIFKMLVQNGADILAKDAKGITPFDLFIERHKPTDISDVLKLHPVLGGIRFENGIKLVDAISAMASSSLFYSHADYSVIKSHLPKNSRLFPGYTLAHLVAVISKVDYRLYPKVNPTIRATNGMTALHLAFRSNKKTVVNTILDKMKSSNDVENCIDQRGLSHLQIACIADKVELVDKLLESDSDPNSPLQNDFKWNPRFYGDSRIYKAGFTLYHIAAANNSSRMVEVISKRGLAKMDLLDVDGLTAVHVGFFNSNPNYRSTLLEKLLSLSETNYTADRAGGLSHLHISCWADDHALVEKFASVATNIDAQICCKTAIDPYANKLASYNGWTPLHFAVSRSHGKIVDLLISKGADLRARAANGLNVLHLALQQVFEGKKNLTYRMCNNKINLIKKLYKEVVKKGEWPDQFGFTRLHVACILEDEYEIKNLLEAGEDVNRQIDANSPILPGNTALHISSICSDSVSKLLSNHGADLTLKNIENLTPLHELWKYQNFFLYQGGRTRGDTMSFISDIIKGAGPQFYRVNPSDNDGLSHFHISCMIGSVDIVKNFFNSGFFDINEPVCPFTSYYAGFGPLHLAARHGNEEVVEFLLQHGANWKLENSAGCTPIQEAVLHNSTKFTLFLSNTQINDQAVDIFGEAILDRLLILPHEKLYHKTLLEHGIRINFVDPPAYREDVARAAWMLDNDFFRTLVERATDVTNIDPYGKNVVHSIGSYNYDDYETCDRCALNVNTWLERGCDINLRDKDGRTPLHDAARIGGAALDVLLMLGADVNISDNEGKTAFSYLKDDVTTREVFLQHIIQVFCSGLHLHDSLVEIVRSKCDVQRVKRNYDRDLASMANLSIAEGLVFGDLLMEKMVKNFRHFHVSKRKIILNFLSPEHLLKDYEKWECWINLFQIQYRKILQRTKLLESARTSFYEHIYQLPLECIEMILDYLSNYDLERLIEIYKH